VKINEIIKLAKDYYSKEGNECGGSLHIVLDDGNLEDDNIKFCINYAKENNDIDGIKIGELLLTLSMTQRNKMYNELCDSWREKLLNDIFQFK